MSRVLSVSFFTDRFFNLDNVWLAAGRRMIKAVTGVALVLLILGGAMFLLIVPAGSAQSNSTATCGPSATGQGLKYSTGAYTYGGDLNDYCFSFQYQ